MIELKLAVCTVCDEQHGYTDNAYAQFIKEHPLYLPGDSKSLDKKFDEALMQDKTMCLVFNDEYALCQMHLEDQLIKIKKYNGA